MTMQLPSVSLPQPPPAQLCRLKRLRQLAPALLGVLTASCGADSADLVGEPSIVPSVTPHPGSGLGPASAGTNSFSQGAALENQARPVVNGTLLVSADGRYAYAADVDRDAIFQIDLTERKVKRIDLEPGAQPGQLVEARDSAGQPLIVAALRSGSAVLTFNPNNGTTQKLAACAGPRGLAYDAKLDRVFIACESGELQTLNPETGDIERSIQLATDLRDVQVLGSNLLVSRYRSAELLVVDEDGGIVSRNKPAAAPECTESGVMHRLLVQDSRIFAAHQVATTATLQTSSGGYSTASLCSGRTVEPVLQMTDDVRELNGGRDGLIHFPTLFDRTSGSSSPSMVSANGQSNAFGLMNRSGPLDIAVHSDARVAMIFTGDSVWPKAGALIQFERSSDGNSWQVAQKITHGILTSVAFDRQGHWIAQAREPAQLSFEDGTTLSLDSRSAANTGLDLFYVNTGSGLSCASCHPEGEEDGRTWSFSHGPRRTQTLRGGVSSRAPFHWDGEMPDMNALIQNVMIGRMAFPQNVTDQQVNVLGRFLDSLPASPHAKTDTAGGAAERGETLFYNAEIGCGRCHSGAEFTDNLAYDVGTGGNFYTPTLLGAGLSESFMHDGCATSLEQRFGLCGGDERHGQTTQLNSQEISDLVAFMRTL